MSIPPKTLIVAAAVLTLSGSASGQYSDPAANRRADQLIQDLRMNSIEFETQRQLDEQKRQIENQRRQVEELQEQYRNDQDRRRMLCGLSGQPNCY